MNLLIAEDNEINQQLITLYVSKMGWDYKMVSNGHEVLETLGSDSFNAVLMDIDMPLMGGIDAARQIRLVNKTIPIIAITSFADEQMRLECDEAGLNAFIAKPCTRDEIISAITECVRKNTIQYSAS